MGEELSLYFLIEGFQCGKSICVGDINFCSTNLIPKQAQESFREQLRELQIEKPLNAFVCASVDKVQAIESFTACLKGLVDVERALDIMTYALFSGEVYRGRSSPYFRFEVLPIAFAIRIRDNWGTPVRHLFEKKGLVDARFSQVIEQASRDYDFLLQTKFDDLNNQTELERILSQALSWYREAEFFLRSRYQSRLAYLLMWIALEHLILADVPLYEIDPRTGTVKLNKRGKPIRKRYSKIQKIKERVKKVVPARTGPSFRDDPRNWVPSFDPKATLDDLYNVRNEIAHQATFLWDWEVTELGMNIRNWPEVVEKTGALKYILKTVIEFIASKHLECKTMDDLWSGI